MKSRINAYVRLHLLALALAVVLIVVALLALGTTP